MCVTWRIHICDMTHSYLWHDAFTCVMWLTHMCDMTHSYVWHASFQKETVGRNVVQPTPMNESCHTYEWVTPLYVWHVAFICVTWIAHMCDMTHSYVWLDSFICATVGTGWRRLIGSPKLQMIFHKRATKYRSLLRKMTSKDKRSYESSPPSTKSGNPLLDAFM